MPRMSRAQCIRRYCTVQASVPILPSKSIYFCSRKYFEIVRGELFKTTLCDQVIIIHQTKVHATHVPSQIIFYNDNSHWDTPALLED